MGLKKGMTNNKKGRPKGTPNRVTGDLRTFVNDLLNDNRKQIISDLKAVEPAERLRVYERLLSYALPKMQQSDSTIKIESLSDADLDRVINELTKN